jgi:hypothetical protein
MVTRWYTGGSERAAETSGGRTHGRLTEVIDDDGVDETSCARRRALVNERQGSGAPAAVVDEGGVSRAPTVVDGVTDGAGVVVGAACGAGGVDGATRARIGASEGVELSAVRATTQGEALGVERNWIRFKEGVKIGGWGGASKGNHIFIENDMTRDEYEVGDEVKA